MTSLYCIIGCLGLRIPCRSTLTSQAIVIWQSALAGYWDFTYPKISIIHILQGVLRNSGDAGIFPWDSGLETMFIFPLAAIGYRRKGGFSISSWYGY